MDKPAVDPKRTGVKARELPKFPHEQDDDASYSGEPGDMVRTEKKDGSLYGFLVACPGCGKFGGIPVAADAPVKWTVRSGLSNEAGVVIDYGPGNLSDVTTLSLSPSILKHCCGWHGFLKNGVFESC